MVNTNLSDDEKNILKVNLISVYNISDIKRYNIYTINQFLFKKKLNIETWKQNIPNCIKFVILNKP